MGLDRLAKALSGAVIAALLAAGAQARTAAPPPANAPPPAAHAPGEDWARLGRYRDENAEVSAGAAPQVVFLGDSITEGWKNGDPGFFDHGILDRGIAGQTSAQMLLRFEQDVVALHPRVVQIMAGTNDIAGNPGAGTLADYRNNIRAMITLARANGIVVILASIPPTAHIGWAPAVEPVALIAAQNSWLKSDAAAQNAVFADYFSPLAGADGAMASQYSADGVHPNGAGYQVMEPVAEAAMAQALRRWRPVARSRGG